MFWDFTVCAFTLGSRKLRQVFNVCSLRRYRLYLHMYNLHLIRKRNCTSCTYASAPSEQLKKIVDKGVHYRYNRICLLQTDLFFLRKEYLAE